MGRSKPVGHFLNFLIRAQPIVGGGLVVLDSIKKQTKQAMRSKPESSIPSWLQVPGLIKFLS